MLFILLRMSAAAVTHSLERQYMFCPTATWSPVNARTALRDRERKNISPVNTTNLLSITVLLFHQET